MVKRGAKGTSGLEQTGLRLKKLTRQQARIKAKKDAINRPHPPGSFKLSKQGLGLIRKNWRPLGGILLVYLLLNIIFASGIGNLNNNVNFIKDELNNSGSNGSAFLASFIFFLQLALSSGANGSATGSVFQAVLIILTSLAIIWSVRQLQANKPATTKLAFYNSMSPLIPFLLVLAFMFIQLLPFTFGSAVIAAVSASLGIVSTFWSVVFGLFLFVLAAWSFYMVSASILALYIVTLPDTQPRQALKSAKDLVRFRRLQVLRKVIFLPILLLVMSGAIVVPLILYATFLVAPVFYIFSSLALLFTHVYFYSFYRSLLE